MPVTSRKPPSGHQFVSYNQQKPKFYQFCNDKPQLTIVDSIDPNTGICRGNIRLKVKELKPLSPICGRKQQSRYGQDHDNHHTRNSYTNFDETTMFSRYTNDLKDIETKSKSGNLTSISQTPSMSSTTNQTITKINLTKKSSIDSMINLKNRDKVCDVINMPTSGMMKFSTRRKKSSTLENIANLEGNSSVLSGTIGSASHQHHNSASRIFHKSLADINNNLKVDIIYKSNSKKKKKLKIKGGKFSSLSNLAILYKNEKKEKEKLHKTGSVNSTKSLAYQIL